jgi:hypothetical protein
VFIEKRASPIEKQVLVATFYQTLHFYEAIACKGHRSIHSPITTKKQSKRQEELETRKKPTEIDNYLVKHRKNMASHTTIRGGLSYAGRLMDLHDSSIFSSEEDRGVILAHLGLRVAGPEVLGACRVTDVTWNYPLGAGMFHGIDSVELAAAAADEEGYIVSLSGSRWFGDFQMDLCCRLKMVFFLEEGMCVVRPFRTGGAMLEIKYRRVGDMRLPSEEMVDECGLMCHWAEGYDEADVGFRSAFLFPDLVEPQDPMGFPIDCQLLRSDVFLNGKGLLYFLEIEKFVEWFFAGDGRNLYKEPSDEEERIVYCSALFGMEDGDITKAVRDCL